MERVKLDYLLRDYESFRTYMINQIPLLLPEWTDYSSSDAGIVILELLSYGLDVVSYYIDRIANEVYLPTATLRQSVIDITKSYGYKLRGPVPSKTYVVFEITPHETENTVIPQGFRLSTKPDVGEEPIFFETSETLVIPPGMTGLEKNGDEYIYKVPVTQGLTIDNEILGSSNGLPNQSFKLRYPNVIEMEDTLRVYINEGQGFQQWSLVDELVAYNPEADRVFRVETDAEDITTIKFGSGTDGKIPDAGINNVVATYRVGGGKIGNVGNNTITNIVNSLNRVKAVTNPEPATGGMDKESIEEAKIKAPIELYTRQRAVTKEDFKLLPFLVNGVKKANAEYEDGVVKIFILTADNFIENEVVNDVFRFIEERKMVGVNHIVNPVDPFELDIKLNILVDPLYNPQILSSLVQETIEDSFTKDTMDFQAPVKMFQIYNLLFGIKGLLNIEIEKLSIIPKLVATNYSGEFDFSGLTTTSISSAKGYVKVTLTSSNGFNVDFDPSGLFNGGETTLGSGSLGSEFNDKISFTLTGSDLKSGDYFTFYIYPFKGDIDLNWNEIALLGRVEVLPMGGI